MLQGGFFPHPQLSLTFKCEYRINKRSGNPTYFYWYKLSYELDTMFLHMFTNFVGHILVKSS